MGRFALFVRERFVEVGDGLRAKSDGAGVYKFVNQLGSSQGRGVRPTIKNHLFEMRLKRHVHIFGYRVWVREHR